MWDAAKMDTRLSTDLATLPERVLDAIEDPGIIGDMFSSSG